MTFHRDLIMGKLWKVYADLTARDADAVSHTFEHINHLVRITNPLSFYSLSSVGPSVWTQRFSEGVGTPYDDTVIAGRVTTLEGTDHDGVAQDTKITAEETKSADFETRMATLEAASSGPKIISFAYADYRFIGERGEPDTQGWVHDAGDSLISVVTATVRGISRKVVELNDDSASLVTVRRAMTAADWQGVYDGWASFRFVTELDTVNGMDGVFLGLQCDQADLPAGGPTGFNYRYGLFANKDPASNNLRIQEISGAAYIVPDTPYNQYNTIELVVPPSLGNATLYVNRVEISNVIQFRINSGGAGTGCLVSSGSSAGTNRVSRHAEGGVIIYKESFTRTLVDADFAGFRDLLIITPPGQINITLQIDGGVTGRIIGATASVLTANLGGTLTFTNLATPPVYLVNGLATFSRVITEAATFTGINLVDNDNVYNGTVTPWVTDIEHISQDLIQSTVVLGSRYGDDSGKKLQITGGESLDGALLGRENQIYDAGAVSGTLALDLDTTIEPSIVKIDVTAALTITPITITRVGVVYFLIRRATGATIIWPSNVLAPPTDSELPEDKWRSFPFICDGRDLT